MSNGLTKSGVALGVFTVSGLAVLSGCRGFSAPTAGDAVPQAHLANLDIDAEIHRAMHEPRPWLPAIPEDCVGLDVPFAACFDPDYPPSPEVVANVNQLIRNSLAKYNLNNRWSSTSF